jgi:hypothetical protein
MIMTRPTVEQRIADIDTQILAAGHDESLLADLQRRRRGLAAMLDSRAELAALRASQQESR